MMSVDDRPTLSAPDDDPYLWLEEIEGSRALDFVARQNRVTLDKFGGAAFERDRDMLAAIYDRPDNIPFVGRRGAHLYNLWKDATHAACGGGPRWRSFANPIRPGKACSISISSQQAKAKTGS
jgi:prolyl oligopeptidase